MIRMTLMALVATAALVGHNTEALAACGVFINGQPMTRGMCARAIEIYGRVVPGYYWMDRRGNWGPIGSRYPQGNINTDAPRPAESGGGSHWGDSPGCLRTEFGSVC